MKEPVVEEHILETRSFFETFGGCVLARYRFASRFVAGKTVVDAACGHGMGSLVLREAGADHVLGLDGSSEAVEFARNHHAADGVEFTETDLHDPLPLGDHRPIDVAVSFETLEHLQEPEQFLDHVMEELADDGVLVISVPNGPRDRLKDNPYHVQFFESAEFEKLLADRFRRVEKYSQWYRRGLRHYLAKLRHRRSVRLARNFVYLPDFSPDAKRWLAVARDPRRGG